MPNWNVIGVVASKHMLLTRKLLGLSTDTTTEPEGMLVPETVMPGTRPAVLLTVTTLLPSAVAATTMVCALVVRVAGALRVKWVASSTEATTAFVGIPEPITATPTVRPVVLATVTWALPETRFAPVRLRLWITGPSERRDRLAES